MNNTEIIIQELEKIILDKLDNLKDLKLEDKLQQAEVLFNIYKILTNYDDLQLLLKQYFSEKAEKEKWGSDDERC